MTKSFSSWQQQQHVNKVWHKIFVLIFKGRLICSVMDFASRIVSRWQLFFQIELRKDFEVI
jgi:hypothetical protein